MMSCGPSPWEMQNLEGTANPGRKLGGEGDWRRTARQPWCWRERETDRMRIRGRDRFIIIISCTPWWHVHEKNPLPLTLWLTLSISFSLALRAQGREPFILSYCTWNLTQDRAKLIITAAAAFRRWMYEGLFSLLMCALCPSRFLCTLLETLVFSAKKKKKINPAFLVITFLIIFKNAENSHSSHFVFSFYFIQTHFEAWKSDLKDKQKVILIKVSFF